MKNPTLYQRTIFHLATFQDFIRDGISDKRLEEEYWAPYLLEIDVILHSIQELYLSFVEEEKASGAHIKRIKEAAALAKELIP